MTTVLSACRDLCMRVGIPAPTRVIGLNNELTLQILGIFVEAARDLSKAHKWQDLRHEAEFNTLADEEQPPLETMAPGLKEMIPRTFVNKTAGHLLVPINAEQHATQYLSPATALGRGYRIVRGRVVIPGHTTAGKQCRFEYHSDLWIMDAAGENYSTLPERDTDLVLLPDEALILGMKWRWKKEKGLAYGEDKNDYLEELQYAKGTDGGEKGDLSINTRAARSGAVGVSSLVIPS